MVRVDPVVSEDLCQLLRDTSDVRQRDIDLLLALITWFITVLFLSWFGSFEHPRFVAICFQRGLDVVSFLFLILLFGDKFVNSVHEGSDYRPFMLEMVIGFKVQVLVGMCGLTINGDLGASIIINMNAGVEERKFAVNFRLSGETYM